MCYVQTLWMERCLLSSCTHHGYSKFLPRIQMVESSKWFLYTESNGFPYYDVNNKKIVSYPIAICWNHTQRTRTDTQQGLVVPLFKLLFTWTAVPHTLRRQRIYGLFASSKSRAHCSKHSPRSQHASDSLQLSFERGIYICGGLLKSSVYILARKFLYLSINALLVLLPTTTGAQFFQ